MRQIATSGTVTSESCSSFSSCVVSPFDHDLTLAVLKEFASLLGFYQDQANKQGIEDPLAGMVSFIQSASGKSPITMRSWIHSTTPLNIVRVSPSQAV